MFFTLQHLPEGKSLLTVDFCSEKHFHVSVLSLCHKQLCYLQQIVFAFESRTFSNKIRRRFGAPLLYILNNTSFYNYLDMAISFFLPEFYLLVFHLFFFLVNNFDLLIVVVYECDWLKFQDACLFFFHGLLQFPQHQKHLLLHLLLLLVW